MRCGAPTTKASSCSPIARTAIRSHRRLCQPLSPRVRGALDARRRRYAFTVFERAVQGIWAAARPSAPTTACPFRRPMRSIGLSQLSVWWLRLGIRHRTHQAGPSRAEWPPRAHASHLEDGSDEAGRRQCPATAGPLRYVPPSLQPGTAAPGARHERARATSMCARPAPTAASTELDYPLHDWTATVTHCGRICFKRRKVNLSQVFAGQNVGVKQVTDRIWLVSFMDYDLGYFDDETCRLEPIEIPSGPKCYLCLRNNPLPMCPEWTRKAGGQGRIRTPGSVSYSGFQDRRHRPLGHLSALGNPNTLEFIAPFAVTANALNYEV